MNRFLITSLFLFLINPHILYPNDLPNPTDEKQDRPLVNIKEDPTVLILKQQLITQYPQQEVEISKVLEKVMRDRKAVCDIEKSLHATNLPGIRPYSIFNANHDKQCTLKILSTDKTNLDNIIEHAEQSDSLFEPIKKINTVTAFRAREALRIIKQRSQFINNRSRKTFSITEEFYKNIPSGINERFDQD